VPAKKIRSGAVREAAADPSTGAWRKHVWRVAALWILVFVAYSNSFDAGLVFDNAAIIAGDPRIHAATAQSLHQIFTGQYWYDNTTSGLYRPLTTLSYLFNYAVLGDELNPQGYHAVNLALHELNVLLVYALGLLIFENTASAFALAALWGLHPLLTESVTNIVGRADLLAAFGVFAGILCYIRGRSAPSGKRLPWVAATAGALTIGLFSKENAAILPALMILYDVTWPRKQDWRDRAVAYGSLVIPFAAFFLLRSQLHPKLVVPFSENPLFNAGFFTARLTAIKVIGKYLWIFFWPARLSADYSFNAVPLFGWRLANWEDAKTLIALAACAGLVLLAILSWRRNKYLFFFVCFFLLTLAPTSNLFLPIGSIMAERFMYIPALGLAGCVVIAIRKIAAAASLPRRSLEWAALALACLLLTLRTYARNADWHDDLTLWTSAVNACPQSARPHNNLGNALLEKSDVNGAIAEFEAALRIRPDYGEAHYNLGKALAQTPARLPEAIAEYQEALRDPPDYSPRVHYSNVHISLGNALARIPGRLPDAIVEYQAALQVDGASASAHYNLGNALARTPGRTADAISEWQAALRIQPDLAPAHYNLGIVYSQDPARLQDALAEYQAALRLNPENAEAHYNLAKVLLQIPDHSADAISELETALRIHPDSQWQRMLEELRARLR
jgi:tetratricopeptide (TPR) repeat protein